jgi:hypothetical protein
VTDVIETYTTSDSSLENRVLQSIVALEVNRNKVQRGPTRSGPIFPTSSAYLRRSADVLEVVGEMKDSHNLL